MLKIYIIGSDLFKKEKKRVCDVLSKLDGVAVLAVGISPLFKNALETGNLVLLHSYENSAIDNAGLIIHVCSKDGINTYTGPDTQRELDRANTLRKAIWTETMFFDNLKKLKDLQ